MLRQKDLLPVKARIIALEEHASQSSYWPPGRSHGGANVNL